MGARSSVQPKPSYSQKDNMDFIQQHRGQILAAIAGPFLIMLAHAFWADRTMKLEAKKEIKNKLSKNLSKKDEMLLDLLSSSAHLDESWVITDPDLPDNPIVYASPGFIRETKYKKEEILGRNCRFLQGKDTKSDDVAKIHAATDHATETSVNIRNYCKDGTPFDNELFISPLFSTDNKLAYYLGVQAKMEKKPKAHKEKPKEKPKDQ